MRLRLRFFSVGLIAVGICQPARAFTLSYLLELSPTTWTLKAKTDAPGGIASIAVELKGVATATSVAPRSMFVDTSVYGFSQGNLFAGNQAFAGEFPDSGYGIRGVGYTDVSDSAFHAPPFTMVGSAIRDQNGYVTFYTGTNSSPFSAQYAFTSPQVWSGSVWANVTATKPIAAGVNLTIQGPLGFIYYVADFNRDFKVDGADFVTWQIHSPTPTGATRSIGDADFDGDVDNADLVVWQNFFPAPTSPTPPVTNPQPGDFDADGDIDGFDFIAWQSNYPLATGGTRAKGDADADGDVDGADWEIWRANFPAQPAHGTPPVPEPQSLRLVLMGLLAVVWRKSYSQNTIPHINFGRHSHPVVKSFSLTMGMP